MTNCLFHNTFIHLLWIVCLSSIAPAQAASAVTTTSPSSTTTGVNVTSDYCAFIGGSFQLVATVYNTKPASLSRVLWIGLNGGTITRMHLYVTDCTHNAWSIFGDDISRYSLDCDSTNSIYTMRINQVEEKDLYTSWTFHVFTSEDFVMSDPTPVLFCGNVISIGGNVEGTYFSDEPSLAVDGNISIDSLKCRCCALLYGTSGIRLHLDLGHTYRISRIILYGATDYGYYFVHMTIRLDSDVVHTTSDWTGFLDLNITSDHTARTVSITFDKDIDLIGICELLVFKGCKDYFFGVNCAKQCHCDGSPCNILSGICQSGRCQAGYSGETCSEYTSTTLNSSHITDVTSITTSLNTATSRVMTTAQQNYSTETTKIIDPPWTSSTTQRETDTRMTSMTPETTGTTSTFYTKTSAIPSSPSSSSIASTITESVQSSTRTSVTTVTSPYPSKSSSSPIENLPSYLTSNISTTTKQTAGPSTRTTSTSTPVTPLHSTLSSSSSKSGLNSPENKILLSTTTLVNSQESTSVNISTTHSTKSSSISTTLSYSTDDNTTRTTAYPTTGTTSALDCGVPNEIENGVAYYTKTLVGSTVTYTCNVGYNLNGDNVTICKEDGQWHGFPPHCEIIDCGPPPNLRNGEFALVGGTTYSSIALYSCNGRFKLNSTTNRRTCLPNGSWFVDIGPCVPIACSELRVPSDGAVSYTNNGSTAHFSCNPEFSLIGTDRLICLLSGSWSGPVPECQRLKIEIQDCPKESDRQNTLWNQTNAGQTVTLDCPEGQEGIISRHCTVDGIWRLPRYACVSAEISAAESTIDDIANTNVTEAVKSRAVADVLGTLSYSTTQSTATENSAMVDGEIEKVTAILEKVASISQDIIVTPEQSEDFIGTTSNLLNPGNSESFKSLEENKEESPVGGADKVLKIVGTFAKAMANSIDNLNGSKTITSTNLVLTVARLDSKHDIQFPEQSMDSLTSAEIPHNFLGGVGSYSGILYHNLSGLLPPRLEENDNTDEANFQINGPVMDMQLLNTTSTPSFQITLTFENFQSGNYDSRCTFWNYNKSLWDTIGCFLNEDKTTSSVTVCTCNHTTNFAILMNPSKTPNVDTKAIDFLTIIGCSISFICLIITIVMYKILWRYMRSDRAVILMNLSVALILAYAVFIAGVDRTEYRAVCTGVAIALHYIYLVVFLLMLSEGIEIFITVVYVFIMKSRLRWLIGLLWGLPVIVVGISVAVTRTEGYGSNEFCWLSSDEGLIWAFLGPALAVLLANYVLLAIVIKTMFKAKTLKQRSSAERVKTGIRCLCVLLPLTGCTWVIGVFYVNEGLAWTQYLFAILNSLQGVVIMVFQCIFNSQIRIAISRRMGVYRASTAFTKSSNNQPRSSEGSSSYQDMLGRFSSDTYNEELTEDYDRSLKNLHFDKIRTLACRHSDQHDTSFM